MQPTNVEEAASFTETTGAIEGFVLDSSLAVVAGANVALSPGSGTSAPIANKTTGDDGRFVFSLLEPGAYRVTADHQGFFLKAQLVQALAGESTSVQLMLADRPTQQPYIELLILSGISSCSVPLFLDIAAVPCAFQVKDTFSVNITESWRYGIWEMGWVKTAQFMMMMVDTNTFCFDTDKCYGVSVHEHPLKMLAEPGTLMQEGGYYEAYPEGEFVVNFIGLYGGMFAREFNDLVGPDHPCPQDNCYGTGVGVEERFTMYLSIFHHQAPSNPDSYTVVPDA